MDEREPSEEVASLRAALAEERRKTEAFAHLSHEIRTLLNGVLGIAGLLIESDLGPEQRSYAKQIRSSGDALVGILNNVLDYSRMEAARLELDRADFDLRRVLEEVGELLAERAHARGIELIVAIPSNLPSALRGDPARLRQVLINLVSNAIKFTGEGEVVLKAAPDDDDDSGRIRFEVTDTGVGISPEGITRLFHPYSQVHEGAGYGGSGLGLTLAKRLVEAMGGTIGVESEVGRGSTFWCAIPFERRAPPTERSAIPRVDVAGRRVVVASASATVRMQLREMVEGLGIECSLAPDAERALRLLRDAARGVHAHDVAIVDANLGELDAPALLRAIQAEPVLAQLRTLVLEYPGQRLDEARVGARVGKPIRQAQLHACLMRLMGSAIEALGAEPKWPDAPSSRRATGDPGRSTAGLASPRGEPRTRSSASIASEPAQRDVIAVDPARRASGTSEMPPSRRSFAPPEIDGPLILLVEDNEINRRVAKVMIERRGYRVDTAGDGIEAAEKAGKAAYAAILMDCQMPRSDGYSATAAIRGSEAADRRTPIVALTANAGPGDREKCLASGMDDYLSKPILAEDLDRILRRWAPRVTTMERAPSSLPPPSTKPQRAPAIDVQMLDRLRAVQRPGQPDLVAEVITLFLEDAPLRLAALRDAVERGDLTLAARLAHTIKGSAGHLGAKTLSAICGRFEEKVRTHAPFNSAFAVTAIAEELDRVRVALQIAGGPQAAEPPRPTTSPELPTVRPITSPMSPIRDRAEPDADPPSSAEPEESGPRDSAPPPETRGERAAAAPISKRGR